MEDGRLVTRAGPGGPYRLGPGNSVASAARQELEALTRATGEPSSVEILAGDETLILDEVQGGHSDRYVAERRHQQAGARGGPPARLGHRGVVRRRRPPPLPPFRPFRPSVFSD